MLQKLITIPSDKCSSHPSLRKHYLKQEETTTETHNSSKYRVVEPSPNRYICSTAPASKSQEISEEGIERL